MFIKIDDADLAALEAGRAIRVELKTSAGDKESIECFSVGRNVRVVLGSIVTNLGYPYSVLSTTNEFPRTSTLTADRIGPPITRSGI